VIIQNVSRDTFLSIPLSSIKKNPHQPRKNFDAVKLQELSESIKTHGLQQPITVTAKDKDGTYTLIAGERRVRAAGLAGLTEIPAIIREGDIAVLALVENLQRDDISAIEEAQGYQDLVDRGETHESIGKLVGKSRTYISQKIRLLKLPSVIKIAMESDYYGKGKLSEGGARQLMRLRILDKVATKESILHDSHMAHFADGIINSPHRLRSVSAIRDQVDWIIHLLYYGHDHTPFDEKSLMMWRSEMLEKMRRGDPLNMDDQSRWIFNHIQPDISKLTEADNKEIYEVMDRVIKDNTINDPGESMPAEGVLV